MATQFVATILIVDDEPLNIDLLEQELADLGYQTISAHSGLEALAKVEATAPDVILLDVMMPGMDGFTVCRQLKERLETRLIPVVFMTALGERKDRLEGIRAGGYDFFTKPPDREILLARIRNAIEMKREIDKEIHDQDVPDRTFRLEGEYWTVAYQGSVCRVKDTVGLHYLAYLLRHPYKRIHVLELVAAMENPPEGTAPTIGRQGSILSEGLRVGRGLGDAGEILDPQAKAAYKQRIKDLRAEVEHAQECNDFGRAARAQQELEFLIQQLREAVGLGGRDRRAANTVDRARVNIQRALKTALEKLTEHHPTLGSSLNETIKTGTFCTYTPELNLPTPWKL
ncbi:MAG: response regulator [Candidatus Binatia bacterium]